MSDSINRKKTLVIAEAGVNHNGSLSRALDMVEVAASAGADAVKFQTFKTDDIVTKHARQCHYQEINSNKSSQYEMLDGLELSYNDFLKICDKCNECSIEFMSTAFDPASLEFLIREAGIKYIKIPSGEITNPLLLTSAARGNLPIILSTGMSELSDIEWAINVLVLGCMNSDIRPDTKTVESVSDDNNFRRVILERLTLMQCTSAYPTLPEDVNLLAMNALKCKFGTDVGLSDHTEGTLAPIAAVAMGASIIEKHFTLDKKHTGPDHGMSLEPDELASQIRQIREVECMLGSSRKTTLDSEMDTKLLARRKIVAKRDIAKGEILTTENLAVLRSESGISAGMFWDFVGTPSKRDYAVDDPIS